MYSEALCPRKKTEFAAVNSSLSAVPKATAEVACGLFPLFPHRPDLHTVYWRSVRTDSGDRNKRKTAEVEVGRELSTTPRCCERGVLAASRTPSDKVGLVREWKVESRWWSDALWQKLADARSSGCGYLSIQGRAAPVSKRPVERGSP